MIFIAKNLRAIAAQNIAYKAQEQNKTLHNINQKRKRTKNNKIQNEVHQGSIFYPINTNHNKIQILKTLTSYLSQT